jgi:hypothetical protein
LKKIIFVVMLFFSASSLSSECRGIVYTDKHLMEMLAIEMDVYSGFKDESKEITYFLKKSIRDCYYYLAVSNLENGKNVSRIFVFNQYGRLMMSSESDL